MEAETDRGSGRGATPEAAATEEEGGRKSNVEDKKWPAGRVFERFSGRSDRPRANDVVVVKRGGGGDVVVVAFGA